MATVLTNDLLQEISVRCASRFITKQASLSEAIADESKNLELNPEQIKRVIETTNTIAYLRQLQGAEDRTAEFPVAEYKQVLSNMALPTSGITYDNVKVAADSRQEIDIPKNDREITISTQEKVAMLNKEMFKCKQVLEKMACDKQLLLHSLLETSAKVKSSENGLEKLAYVSDEIDYDKLVKLCGLEKTASLKNTLVFTDSDLDSASKLCGLYKQAQELLKEEQRLKELLCKAASIMEGLGYHVGNAFGNVARAGANKVAAGAGRIARLPINRPKSMLGRALRFGGAMGMASLGVTHNNSVWGSLN